MHWLPALTNSMLLSSAVAIDDQDQDLDQPFSQQTKAANVTFAPYAEGVGEQLNISTDLFSYVIKGVRAFEDDITGYNR